jgi:hypothetical protein
MPQNTLAQARVINPVLTGIAQGFNAHNLVGNMLFPEVPVNLRAGQILTFGKEEFMQYSGLQRAPGAQTKRVQFGYAGSPFALVDYSLEGSLPIETLQEGLSSANGFSIDGAAVAINKTQKIMARRLELQQAALATTLGNYPAANRKTLSGTAQLSDLTSNVSDPINEIEIGKDVIRAAIGMRPNTLVMGARVLQSMRQHPKIIDRMKYTGRDVPTLEILKGLFDIENIVVGEAVTATDAGVFSDIWGKHIVLAYTSTGSIADMGEPTFGYTYNLGGYPVVEEPYYDRNSKTWFFPVTRAEAPVIAGSSAGYLIQNAVA